MASKSIAISGCELPQLSWSRVSLFKPLNWIGSLNTARRDVWFGAIRAEVSQSVDRTVTNVSGKLQKDFSSFPRPLTVADFSADPDDGMKVRISYKGLPGSYSEDAALKAYPKCETVPCDEFEEAFKAVELWLADKAVLPIECSIAGSIHRNYDLLLRHRLHIVGEVLDMSDIFLSKLSVARESVDDAAGAAQYIASNELRDAGAVASRRASEIYGLNIVAENVQDDSDNVIRFLVLARDPIIPRADKLYKTSIVFTLDEGPGVLFKALAVFALRDINLTKIESRPQRKQPLRVVDDSNTGSAKYFDYLFYIDFEASMAEPRAQNALGHLQEFATFLRVLGCYPTNTIAL
ncbi:hypothetical protein MANES_12G074000v8 [Manihot esculenta]|uniref:Uncharacterized protein n=1 Tax=Manihot esculenta TaxID=3983 RepID=A0ACB7GPS1_MANES|nr:hypothetical protein MANES_12G074000v8 [Manihot esculenta]